jgi:cytochrome c peroxidase
VSGARVFSSSNQWLLLTGQPADLGVMESTQLRGISRTAPYFHNNSAATLDEVLDLYDAFFRRSQRLFPPPNLPPSCRRTGPRSIVVS